MKLTVIGFWGGYPAPGGATSSYLLEQDGFTLLIDAGSGALSRLQTRKQLTDLDAVILSHYHHDHVADIGVLQYGLLSQSFIRNDGSILPIYGHQEDADGFASLTHKYTEGIAYDPAASLEIGPFTITFLKTVHPVPCYGMRISNGETVMVYTADSAFQEAWCHFAEDADVLLADCNFYADQDGSQAGHMTSQECGSIAQKANVQELILSHLPQYGERDDLVREAEHYFSGKVRLAGEGVTWEK